MCDACVKWQREFQNGQLQIRRVHCTCPDCSATELTDPPRCVKCGCKIPIQLTDDAEAWIRNPEWLDEKGEPVRRDGIRKMETLETSKSCR
jgi:hypothetical protein